MSAPEFLFGIHPVFEALRAKRRQVRTLFVAPKKREKRVSNICDLAEKAGVPITTVSENRLQDHAQNPRHQGIVAEVTPYPLSHINRLLDTAASLSEDPFFLIADQIVDPQNLGALIRTALAAGVHGVITPKDRCARPTPMVSKASAGALEHIQFSQVTNLSRTFQDLKAHGIWIYGLDHTAGNTIYTTTLTGPVAIVIGGEGKGIRPLVKNSCDQLVSIPQAGAISSLNASAAGAVALYETFRQRKMRKG